MKDQTYYFSFFVCSLFQTGSQPSAKHIIMFQTGSQPSTKHIIMFQTGSQPSTKHIIMFQIQLPRITSPKCGQ